MRPFRVVVFTGLLTVDEFEQRQVFAVLVEGFAGNPGRREQFGVGQGVVGVV